MAEGSPRIGVIAHGCCRRARFILVVVLVGRSHDPSTVPGDSKDDPSTPSQDTRRLHAAIANVSMDGATTVASIEDAIRDTGESVEGKHPNVSVQVTGRVEALRPVSKRLLFFRLVNEHNERRSVSWECMAKDRDGFLSAADVSDLSAALADQNTPAQVELVAFPECGEGGLVLHVKAAALQDGRRFPATDVTGTDAPTDGPGAEPPAAAPSITRWKRSGNRVRPNNETRHQRFVAFLVDTFGVEALRRGSGVLDVAGGAGGVAFELAFRWNIPCTVVDPRPMKLSSKQRRAFDVHARDLRTIGGAQSVSGEEQPSTKAGAPSLVAPPPSMSASTALAPPAPPEVGSTGSEAEGWEPGGASEGECTTAERGGGDDGLVCIEACPDDPEDEEERREEEVPVAPAYSEAAAAAGLVGVRLPRQLVGLFGDHVTSEWPRLWRECSVVVGMHPDQATEPIVDLALRAGKPFAVVPCCVFPKASPNRRTADGARVTKHEHFCRYLGEKDPYRIQRVDLPDLEGRATVLYAHGSSC